MVAVFNHLEYFKKAILGEEENGNCVEILVNVAGDSNEVRKLSLIRFNK